MPCGGKRNATMALLQHRAATGAAGSPCPPGFAPQPSPKPPFYVRAAVARNGGGGVGTRPRGARSGLGDIPTFHTAGDVDSLKSGLQAKIGVVDPVARACGKLSSADETGWGTFYIRVMQFVQSPTPSTINVPGIQSQYGAGTDYSVALDTWIQQLNAAGCTVPIVNVPGKEGVLATLTKYGAAAAGVALALALGYGIFTVARAVKSV
jgi:hypothetical protein